MGTAWLSGALLLQAKVESQMQSQRVYRSQHIPAARRGYDRFVRGVVASVILGLAAWPLIILGVLFVIRFR